MEEGLIASFENEKLFILFSVRFTLKNKMFDRRNNNDSAFNEKELSLLWIVFTILLIIMWGNISFFKGDLKNKLKKGKLCMNNSKVIANSINHRDYRLDNDYINQNEDDTIRWIYF